MRNPFNHAKQKRLQLDALEKEFEQYKQVAEAREPRVNELWKWSRSRRITNGVGADFEWTLSNPRQFRGSAT